MFYKSVILEILKHLEDDNIVLYKLVSKKWQKWINGLDPKYKSCKLNVSNLLAYSNLKCCHDIGSRIQFNSPITFCNVAREGNLEVMKWLKTRNCHWDESTFTAAARHGELANMKWLLSQKCPGNIYTFEAAAEHGNLENMKWLLDTWLSSEWAYVCWCCSLWRFREYEMAKGK